MAEKTDIQELLARIEALEARVALQEDIEAIRRLQWAYNYYNTNSLHKQAMDLVSENAISIEIGGRGVYYGKKGFIQCFSNYGGGEVEDRGKPFGRALFQLAAMDVITVAPDRKTAQCRLQVLTPIFAGFPNTRQQMNAGVYEMEYARENGIWLITKFKYVHVFAVTWNKDGTISPGYSTAPDGKADAPTTWYHPFPEAGVMPMHFANPVTGAPPLPELHDPKHYWVGNWPGEYGKVGTVAET